MIASLDPSPFTLARLYAPQHRPLRLSRRTAFAVGVAVAFHVGVGYVLIHNHFTMMQISRPAEPPAVVVDFPFTPKVDPKPVTAKTPPQTAPATHVSEQVFDTPVEPVHIDAAPPMTPPVGPLTTVDPLSQIQVASVTPPVQPKAPPVIANPNWISRPTGSQVNSAYPRRAADDGVGGKATLMCEVLTTGSVNNCQVVDETPKGYRFGDAAMSMTRYFKLSPKTVDGVSVAGSKVRIPIVFNAG